MPLVLPHALVKYLHGVKMLGKVSAPAELRKFWRHFKTRTDPSVRWPHYFKRHGVIPMGLHGDDCRYTETNQKIICVSLNFLLDERQERYPLFVIRFASWYDQVQFFWMMMDVVYRLGPKFDLAFLKYGLRR